MEQKSILDPATYDELNEPVQRDEADARLTEFLEELRELRRKHGLPDVHVVARINVKGAGTALASMHIGAQQEAEGMAAWAFARAGTMRRDFVDHMKALGASAASR